jgi:soluble lytic murein transglycosylase-like protein
MISTQYDEVIKGAAAEWLPDVPWQWCKAEWLAESGLNPNITNPKSGAQGICQFMPATFRECAYALGIPATVSAFEPISALKCGAYYLRRMWDQWHSPRPFLDRLQLTQATYDAGIKNMARAQKVAGGALDYDSIIAALPTVTGAANADETANYVRKIAAFHVELTA